MRNRPLRFWLCIFFFSTPPPIFSVQFFELVEPPRPPFRFLSFRLFTLEIRPPPDPLSTSHQKIFWKKKKNFFLFRFKQENRKMLMPSCFFLFLFIYHTGKPIPSLIPDFNGVCSIIILTILADSFDCIFSWIVRFSFQFIFSFSSQMNFLFRRKFFSFLILPRDFLSDSTHTPPFSYLERLHKKDRRNVYRVTSFEGKDLKKWTKFWKKKDKKKLK